MAPDAFFGIKPPQGIGTQITHQSPNLDLLVYGRKVHDLASSWESATSYLADDGLKAFGFVIPIDPVNGYTSEDSFAWQEPFANEGVIQSGLQHLDNGLFSGHQ